MAVIGRALEALERRGNDRKPGRAYFRAIGEYTNRRRHERGRQDMGHHKTEAQTPEEQPNSKWRIFLILAGLVMVGVAAGYKWLRGLPR
jgi:hypothetical protein